MLFIYKVYLKFILSSAFAQFSLYLFSSDSGRVFARGFVARRLYVGDLLVIYVLQGFCR